MVTLMVIILKLFEFSQNAGASIVMWTYFLFGQLLVLVVIYFNSDKMSLFYIKCLLFKQH